MQIRELKCTSLGIVATSRITAKHLIKFMHSIIHRTFFNPVTHVGLSRNLTPSYLQQFLGLTTRAKAHLATSNTKMLLFLQ